MEKFENQYLLYKSSLDVNKTGDWEEIEFTSYNLRHCPKLKAFEYKSREAHIVLLGFSFHALHPNWRENDILLNLPLDEDQFLNYLDCLCGNYVLLIEINGHLKMYNDAAAALKIFYHLANEQVTCVGPDPAILHEHFQLEKFTEERVLEFYESNFFVNNHIRLGDKTIFKDTFQVLPNHSLSLTDNFVERYFPRQQREELPVDKAIEKVHQYFSNIMEAAESQFDLKCSLTAGWDSKVVASLTKDFHDSVEYYTFIDPPFKKSHPDVSVSKKIADRLKLNYKQYKRPIMLDDKEIENAKASFVWLGDHNIQAILGGFSVFNNPNQLLLIGNVSEICKNYFDNVKINDGKSLTQAAHFPVVDYVVEHFEKSYSELKEIESKYKYDLRDIAHWEQDISNFASMGILYRSLTTKTFSPFNCRLIINTILSTPREYRDKQQHLFYHLYIEKYYPELNEFRVNPNLKSQLIVFAKKIGIYGAYKILSTKLRK